MSRSLSEKTGRLRIEPNFDFPGLVLIAAEERVLEPPHAFGYAGRLHKVVAVGAQSAQELIHALGVELPAAGVEGAILLPAQIRDQAAERRQAGDKSRNKVTLQTENVRHLGDVAGSAASAANEETIARVDSLPHGDLFDGCDHVMIAGGRDRVCGLLTAHAEMLRDPIHRLFRKAAIELDAAAKKEVGVENPEHDIGVGYGRVGAPLSIAGRPGPGARAMRADVQKSA